MLSRLKISYLEDVNHSETDLDSNGRAFETFMTSFDATGKETEVNELEEIGIALADFIRREAEA